MNEILKAARVKAAGELSEEELRLINAQTLRSFGKDEVFTFRLAACDTQVDRDNECFTLEALEQMAQMYVGRPVLRDHKWSASTQTARVYAASVEGEKGSERLVLRCYMPRTEANRDTIAAIEGGILRECSVGLAVGKVECSICGANQTEAMCRHFPGREYDGKRCHMALSEVVDVFEVSLCAVPSQSEAGVVKSKRYGKEKREDSRAGEIRDPGDEKTGEGPEDLSGIFRGGGTYRPVCAANPSVTEEKREDSREKEEAEERLQGEESPEDNTLLLAQARQEQEEKRYGGKFA